MDNFNLDELMDLAEAYVGPMIDAIYRRLIDRDFALEDLEVVMLLTDRPDQHLGARQPWGPPHGSPVDGSIWRKRSTRAPEHESDEVEKRGSLRE